MIFRPPGPRGVPPGAIIRPGQNIAYHFSGSQSGAANFFGQGRGGNGSIQGARNGVVNGATPMQGLGQFGNCIQMPGSGGTFLELSQNIDLGTDSCICSNLGNHFTIMLWLKMTGGGASTQTIYNESRSSAAQIHFFYSASHFGCQINDSATNGVTSGMTPSFDTWYHVAVTFAPAGYASPGSNLYVNGKLEGTATGATNLVSGGTKNYLGVFNRGTGGFQFPFLGQMELLTFFDRALSPEEIQAHYSNPMRIYRPRRLFSLRFPPSSIGSSSKTCDDTTGTASGTAALPTGVGTSSKTCDNTTGTSSGTAALPTGTGTSNVTLADATGTSAGTADLPTGAATSNVTLADTTASSTGTAAFPTGTGTSTATLADTTGSATGTAAPVGPSFGSSDVTLGGVSGVGVGSALSIAALPGDVPVPYIERQPHFRPRNAATEMDSGRRRKRRIDLEVFQTIDVQWRLVEDQFHSFLQFFDRDLNNGSRSFFLVTLEETDDPSITRQWTREVAFMDPNLPYQRSDNLFMVSATLEVVTAASVDFANSDLESTGGVDPNDPWVEYPTDCRETVTLHTAPRGSSGLAPGGEVIEIASAAGGPWHLFMVVSGLDSPNVVLNNDFPYPTWMRVLKVGFHVVHGPIRLQQSALSAPTVSFTGSQINNVLTYRGLKRCPYLSDPSFLIDPAQEEGVYSVLRGRWEYAEGDSGWEREAQTIEIIAPLGAVVVWTRDGSNPTLSNFQSGRLDGFEDHIGAERTDFGYLVKVRYYFEGCVSPLTVILVDKKLKALKDISFHGFSQDTIRSCDAPQLEQAYGYAFRGSLDMDGSKIYVWGPLYEDNVAGPFDDAHAIKTPVYSGQNCDTIFPGGIVTDTSEDLQDAVYRNYPGVPNLDAEKVPIGPFATALGKVLNVHNISTFLKTDYLGFENHVVSGILARSWQADFFRTADWEATRKAYNYVAVKLEAKPKPLTDEEIAFLGLNSPEVFVVVYGPPLPVFVDGAWSRGESTFYEAYLCPYQSKHKSPQGQFISGFIPSNSTAPLIPGSSGGIGLTVSDMPGDVWVAPSYGDQDWTVVGAGGSSTGITRMIIAWWLRFVYDVSAPWHSGVLPWEIVLALADIVLSLQQDFVGAPTLDWYSSGGATTRTDVPAPVPKATYSGDDFEAYLDADDVSMLTYDEGTGWDGPWTFFTYPPTLMMENWEQYADAAVDDNTTPSTTYNLGDGWAEGWIFHSSFHLAVTEDWESYSDGPAFSSVLAGGSNWDGPWFITNAANLLGIDDMEGYYDGEFAYLGLSGGFGFGSAWKLTDLTTAYDNFEEYADGVPATILFGGTGWLAPWNLYTY